MNITIFVLGLCMGSFVNMLVYRTAVRYNLKVYKIHKVTFQWIKGHAGHHWNEEADKLAVAAANKPENFKIDSYFEIHQNEE